MSLHNDMYLKDLYKVYKILLIRSVGGVVGGSIGVVVGTIDGLVSAAMGEVVGEIDGTCSGGGRVGEVVGGGAFLDVSSFEDIILEDKKEEEDKING